MSRRQPAVRPVLRPLPALRVRARASKYIYIDAFRCQIVTRETLLRYMVNSIGVNNLIGGNLWKTPAHCIDYRSWLLALIGLLPLLDSKAVFWSQRASDTPTSQPKSPSTM